jgi:eukaryotic-like serine/threonine-protein kinase
MNADAQRRWIRASALFDELADSDEPARAARLAALREAGEDPAVIEQLAAMLAADAAASGVLDRGVQAMAPTVVDALAQGQQARADEGAPAPASIGRFRLVRLLGRGGMGEVYLAESTQGDFVQQVALKLLKRGMDSDEILRRFAQERRILAQLNHAHIAALVDGGVSAEGRPYYAMEYVAGEALTDYARSHALGARERVQLMALICDAVAHAQSRLVVHRDLKPSNILVDADGQPRVLDFGIAKILGDSAEDGLTRTGARALSPAYAAPEQIRGEPVSTATDVYALGVVLYELLCGRLPHRRSATAPEFGDDATTTVERPSQVLRKTTVGAGKGPYAHRSAEREARQIAGDLDTVVLTALHREPERRYANASALGADLRRWLEGRTINARPDSARYRTWRFVRRHRVGVAVSAFTLVFLVVSLGVALWQARIANAERNRATEQAAIATAVSNFLTEDVIRSANPYRSKLDLSMGEALTQARGSVAQRFAGQPRTEGAVRRALAESLRLAGEREPAEQEARAALDVLAARFGHDDPDALRSRGMLGRLLLSTDEEAARRIFTEGMAFVGASPRDPARLRFELGLAGLDVEDRKEDEGLRRLAAIESDVRAVFGDWSEEHFDLLNHRMRSYANTDRYEQTLVVARETLAGAREHFGEGDPRTLEWLQREAISLRLLKRFEESLASIKAAIAIANARLGETHPATLYARLQAGIVLLELRRFDEAGPEIDPIVDYDRNNVNVTTENVLTHRVYQARQRQFTGKTAEAQAMFESIYADARQLLGATSPKALPYGQTLGMFLMQTGQRAEAETLQRRLIAEAEQVLTPGHVNVAKYAFDLVENLSAQPERAADILPLLEKWLPIWEKDFGADDSRTVDGRKWLAEAKARIAKP